VKQFSTRARWAYNFGGVTAGKTYAGMTRTLLDSLVRSSDYSVADLVRTMRGIMTTQAALLPELATTDLVSTMPSLDIPIAIAQGRLDQVAPGEATQRFYDSLKAPSKQLVWFENSAHTPQFDEPGNFRQLLLDVKAAHLAE
jgi:pimeloyl-ACP methyl ester carboxylesterase